MTTGRSLPPEPPRRQGPAMRLSSGPFASMGPPRRYVSTAAGGAGFPAPPAAFPCAHGAGRDGGGGAVWRRARAGAADGSRRGAGGATGGCDACLPIPFWAGPASSQLRACRPPVPQPALRPQLSRAAVGLVPAILALFSRAAAGLVPARLRGVTRIPQEARRRSPGYGRRGPDRGGRTKRGGRRWRRSGSGATPGCARGISP